MKTCTSLALLCFVGLLPSQAALTDSLVAYWNFEGNLEHHAAASGGTAYNGTTPTTTSGNNATPTGTPRVGTGALSLDGAGDYMDASSIVDVNQPWSVSAWYRADLAPSTTRFMVFESRPATIPSTAGYAMSFGLREATTTTNTNHQTFADVTPTADVSANQQIADTSTALVWHHVTLVFTPATPSVSGTLVTYIDGAATSTLTIPAGSTLVPATGFHIGTYRSANDRWFDGSIDEVAIWNRGLSPAEVTTAYQLGSNGEALTTLKYQFTLSASPGTGGLVTGTGLYNAGQSVSVSATPNPGYVFSSWDGPLTGQPASFTTTASADVTATATFGQDTADNDGDGLTNYQEIVTYGTLPNNPDTDGDQIPDGAETQIGTAPLVSDAALVAFVQNNLSPGNAGAIALTTPRISRDPGTGAITLSMGLSGSADQAVWQAINLADPSVSIVPSGNGWDVTIPAPSNTVNNYILRGSQP